MRQLKRIFFVVTMLVLSSKSAIARDALVDKITSLHSVLESLYKEMIPLCENLIDVGRVIGGFGALWYISSRVWRNLANAEPIDWYPLFRPFAIGFCLGFYTTVVDLIDTIMEPTVAGTAELVKGSNQAIEILLKQKEKAVMESDFYQMYVGADKLGNREKWLRYTEKIGDNEALPNEDMFDRLGNNVKFALAKTSYNFRNSIKEVLSEILQLLFQAAALCIDTLRTFQRIVLVIIGPIVFGLAIFDGLQQSLTAWLSRYLNVFLWLPVCNIFSAIIGKIQEKMLALDLSQIATSGDTFFSANDSVYMIFMVIAITGYTTVPSVASFIVNGGSGGALLQKVTAMTMAAGKSIATGGAGMAASAGMSVLRNAGTTAGNIANARKFFNEGLSGEHKGAGAAGAVGRSLGHLAGRLGAKPPDDIKK
jgi:conjugative transposon TraJ protein